MPHVGHLHWLFPICPTLGLEQTRYSACIAEEDTVMSLV